LHSRKKDVPPSNNIAEISNRLPTNSQNRMETPYTQQKSMRNHGKTQPEMIKMKDYEILYDTGKVRKLVACMEN
jgi:hypothetical protein